MVAAEGRELAGLAQQLSGRRKLSLSLGFAEQGELGGRRWLLAANGPGPKLAAAAVKAFERPDRIVSTGYCGALDPALLPSDMVICNRCSRARIAVQAASEFGATFERRPRDQTACETTVTRDHRRVGAKWRLRRGGGPGHGRLPFHSVAGDRYL